MKEIMLDISVMSFAVGFESWRSSFEAMTTVAAVSLTVTMVACWEVDMTIIGPFEHMIYRNLIWICPFSSNLHYEFLTIFN